MTRRDDKQVTEALQAIRKLVEMSEDKMGKGDDIVTLDHVVWRNPIKDEDEIFDDTADTQQPITKSTLSPEAVAKDRSLYSDNISVSEHQRGADSQETARSITQTAPIAASGIVTARELDGLGRKPLEMSQIVRKREPVAASLPPAPQNTEPTFTPSPASVDNQSTAETPDLPLASDQMPPTVPNTAPNTASNTVPITELTQPLGRRGGGYYTGLPRNPSVPDMMVKPAIEAVKPEPKKTLTQPDEVLVSGQGKTDDTPSENAPRNAGFPEEDFSFHIAETPMSRLSFDPITAEASGEMPHVIQPNIQVPIAQPAVENPAQEVQKMFAPEPEEQSDEATAYPEPEVDFDEPISHPTLHIVSDTSFEEEEDAPGFSGAVRGALRSIIKEQVSSWLQGNMTDLIEEALTSPQKRPKSSRKPSSKSKG